MKKTLLSLGAILIGIAFYTNLQAQNVIYVDSANVSGTHDGTSWATAYDSLQYALSTVNSGDSIFVAKGTYQPDSSYNFQIGQDINVYGGFPTGGGTFAQRNWNTHPTILKGNYAPVVSLYNTDSMILDGFSITNGREDNSYGSGAGIIAQSAAVKLNNLRIYGDTNTIGGGAGGIYIHDYSESMPVILNNVLVYNNYEYYGEGDGIYEDDGLVTINNSKIYDNASGGIYNYGIATISDSSEIYGNPSTGIDNENTMTLSNGVMVHNNGQGIYNDGNMNADNVQIFNNAGNDGAGIYNSNGTLNLNHAAVYNNAANSSYSYGGGLYIDGGNVTVSNAVFYNDSATSEGGAVYNYGYPATFTNVLFYNNYVDTVNGWDGGAIASDGGNNTIINCTFYYNLSPDYSVIDSYDGSSLTINNSVFWDNKNYGIDGPNDIDDEDGTASIAYNYTQSDFSSYSTTNIQGTMNPFEDTTNIKGADNMLMTADDGLELTCGSAAINNGDNSALGTADTTDITGNARIKLGVVDMGAYENLKGSESILTTSACGNFMWQGRNYNATGNYYGDTLTNAAGCDSLTILDLTINPYADTAVVKVQNSLVAIDQNVASYQWIFCDSSAISGANNQSFTATQGGSYAVVLTTQLGCVDTSGCNEVAALGIKKNSFSNLSVYPNPTNDGNFMIDLGKDYQNVHITLTDITGKVIKSETLKDAAIVPMKTGDAKGIYILHITSQDGITKTFQLMKN